MKNKAKEGGRGESDYTWWARQSYVLPGVRDWEKLWVGARPRWEQCLCVRLGFRAVLER